jgi:hypothetical protein
MCLAYIGPGGGLTAIGALMALIGVCAVTFLGFLWYPIKRLLKKLKSSKHVSTHGEVKTTKEA